MVYFHTKNPNFGIVWRALEWKLLEFYTAIWNILRPFGICHGSLVNVVIIWYILPFWYVVPKKSGNPVSGDDCTLAEKIRCLKPVSVAGLPDF
jgi:hypothetical protein